MKEKIKTTIKNVQEKSKFIRPLLTYIFRRTIYLFISIVLLMLIAIFLPSLMQLYITLLTSAIGLVIVLDLLKLLNTDYLEKRRIKKSIQSTEKIDLFDWITHIDTNEVFLYKVLENRDGKKYSLIENLNELKQSILEICDHELEKLKLLKVYIENQVKNDFSDKVFTVPILLIIPIIAQQILTSEKALSFVSKLFDHKSDGKLELFSSYIYYSSIGISLFAIILVGWNLITKQKRRLKLVLDILNLCIQERESNK